MNERQSRGLTKLAGACLQLFLGMAISGRGAPPDKRLDYPSSLAQAIADVKRGQVEAGEARMREAVRQAEEAGDLARIYWESWQLARCRGPAWSLSQRLAWFDVAEDALKRRDRTHFKWRTADLPNYIQLLCEKETVLAAQGRRGLAFLACRQAAELLREHWGPMEGDADLRRAPALHIGILLNLRLDQAEHLESAGRIDEAARLYEQCLAVAEIHLAGHADHAGYMSRAANNYAVMLGLVGRDEEEEKWQAEALAHRGGSGGDLIAEANQLRRESRIEGPSDPLVQRLLDKADRLAEANRGDASLDVRRRAASILYELGRTGEAETQFEQVVREAQAREFRVVAANALYWRGKARGWAGAGGAEEDFLAALEAYRRHGAKPYEGRLYQAYADFLQHQGRLEDALRMVNEGLRLNRSLNLDHLRPEMLMLKADILEKAGRWSESEAVWADAMERARHIAAYSQNRGLKVRMGHLRSLARRGRKEDLARELEATRAFVEASGLTEFQTRAFREFKPDVPDAAAAATVPAVFPVAIAPVYTATHVPPDQPAKTMFWLMNPSMAERKGRLRVRGAGEIAWIRLEAAQVEVELRGGEGDGDEARELVVAGDDVLAIRLVHVQPPAEGARVTLTWLDEPEATAEWQVAVAAGPSREESTIHYHFAQQNAFYSVALYHEIGVAGSGGGLNYRMRGSVPSRVEIYDAESLVLLAVDAQGDGDFGGIGDVLTRDADLDGYPDTDRAFQPVVMHVFPVNGQRYVEPLDVALDIRTGGEWRPIGLDRLVDMPAGTKP